MLIVLVFTCPQSPSLALSPAAQEVRSAGRPCRGSPPSAAPTQPRHLEARYGRIRMSFGPTDKRSRGPLAAARVGGTLCRCGPCARGCLNSSKWARARADGEESGRARKILSRFSNQGELSERRDAPGLACAHFYAVPVGGARGAQMTSSLGHQKTSCARRSAAQSTFLHAQQ